MVVSGKSLGMNMPRWKIWSLVGAAVAVLLLLAWFDGGEEPLHPIVEDLATPGASS